MWAEDPLGDDVAAANSSGGSHDAEFLLPRTPAEAGAEVLPLPEDEFLVAFRARARIPYPAYLLCFKRERGPAQQCNHQYSKGSKVCGHGLVRADGTPDVKGKHQQKHAGR